MPGEKPGGAREVVLEDRHLFAAFLAVVLLCALFFTLGFILGRNQGAAQQASAPTEKKPPAANQPAGPAAGDLSFYDRVGSKPANENLKPSSAPPAATTTPSPATAKPTSPNQASPSANAAGPFYVQVAALREEPDAKRLAQDLEKLGFSAVIRPPKGDALYRVLVGPLENEELAAAAKRRLEAHGFRPMILR